MINSLRIIIYYQVIIAEKAPINIDQGPRI